MLIPLILKPSHFFAGRHLSALVCVHVCRTGGGELVFHTTKSLVGCWCWCIGALQRTRGVLWLDGWRITLRQCVTHLQCITHRQCITQTVSVLHTTSVLRISNVLHTARVLPTASVLYTASVLHTAQPQVYYTSHTPYTTSSHYRRSDL